MKKNKILRNDYFLNSLALEHQRNPAHLRLRKVLWQIYQFAQPEDFMEMLDAFFTASMDTNSTWKAGNKPSAGNSIFVLQQIEMIIEACYLLNKKYSKKASNKNNHSPQQQQQIPANLPLLLSQDECRQPTLVLSSFFEYQPLPQWKKLLQEFTINALGYSSVTDAIDEKHLFPFTQHVRKLVWAGYLLSIKL